MSYGEKFGAKYLPDFSAVMVKKFDLKKKKLPVTAEFLYLFVANFSNQRDWYRYSIVTRAKLLFTGSNGNEITDTC